MSEVLISAVQILTGNAGERIRDGAVLVIDGKIGAVGSRAELATLAPEGIRELAFPQATLLPGLIDCHVHLAFDASADVVAALQATEDDELLEGMTARARQLLDAGVTTARDLGDRGGLVVRLRKLIDAGEAPGPRLLSATAPLTLPGGHCWFFGGEVDGERAIREQVRRNAEAGADVIKVMATGGHLTPGGAAMWEPQFTPEELQVVVEEARRHGLPVAAHAHGTDGIVAATRAGVDTIEHCTWLSTRGVDVREDVIAEIAARGIYVCPALSRNWKGLAKRFGAELTETLLGHLGEADAKGVRLAAGTDSGIPGAVFGDYVGALEVFEHVGFSNERIIELATAAAADALGLGNTTGRIQAGLQADLIVVDGDPTHDLQALRQVRHVFTQGREHAPPSPVANR
jgi:imidazolonepropionase-like amidohydrolase